jgi:Flp pilus assembly protein TadG
MERMKRGRRRKRRGAALVEAALVLLLLIVITLAAFQYGWLFLCAQRVTNAARQGARMECVLDAPAGTAKAWMLQNVSDLGPTGDSDITTAAGVVTATLAVPANGNPKVQLLDLPFLPVPALLRVVVKMAKEGEFAP